MENNSFFVLEDSIYTPRSEVCLNPNDISSQGLVTFIYVNVIANNGKEVKCLLTSSGEIPQGNAKISKRSKELLGGTITNINIIKPQFESFNRGIPKVENISNSFVYACTDLVDKYSNDVEIINPKNGFRINIKIKSYPNAKPKTIYINRYTLLLLGVPPGEKNHKLIITSNKTENRTNILAKVFVCFTFIKKIPRIILHNIGFFLVGYRELSIRISYLYPFDETHNLARLHPNTRKVMGIEETDKLVVSYKDKKVVLPVLDIDTRHVKQIFKIEDEFIDSHLYIGIPAAYRKELDIPNIGTVVKVRRSMKFLLFKHVNKLVLPVLALLFTILQLFVSFDMSFYMLVSIITVFVPIIIYSAVSEERAKIK
ncbi:hypothetical protein [Pseudalkalibacillus hwajinpoensis]|uniref:hypothetical protein n=1 Tax=Guptibacillus hwajinpoensis TaxID=208199 RepID=UPI001CD550C1|nr:hypothetical protein [Pseudalkalibacillus hwajinpoensis]MCA0991396.1 hypothetical protein [Pseudalkalibacillus hwajinpoensis]